jgi:multidrug efflux pump
MNISSLFIRRPVATALLAVAILLQGVLAYFSLPVSPLPNITMPVVVAQASMAGASPEVMAATVAEPLEKRLAVIAGVSQLTSTSYAGSAQIVAQFDVSRDINAAERDVQAAIQAARADLPSTLRSNPTIRTFNPSDAPVMILALTSDTLTNTQLYDSASTIMQQQLSQVSGVGQITLGGAALPSVRVELEPDKLTSYGIGLEDLRAAISAANANSAKGSLDQNGQRFEITSNDQAKKAADYINLIVAYRNGSPVYLHDLAQVIDSSENIRNLGLYNGKPAVIVVVNPIPGANVVRTNAQINAILPKVEASLPAGTHIGIVNDRSQSIRGAVDDTERTLLIAVVLVILVVFVFLQSGRATLIPAVALPLSIIGTFGPMYLLHYNIDNLSMMALTIGTGFVVDDAVVVLENIMRHLDEGMDPFEAALQGSKEVSFTVLSMSLSLIAVFIPILLMPGVVGLLFHEFAVTLSIAIMFSMLISLTVTPCMCAYVLRAHDRTRPRPRWARIAEGGFDRFKGLYARSLAAVLGHARLAVLTLLGLIVLNVVLFKFLPSTFFPEQDNGMLMGQIVADQNISFPAMAKKLRQLQAIVQSDPAVAAVAGAAGAGSNGRAGNTANVYISLKPLAQRKVDATTVATRLRPKLDKISGAKLFLQAQQDLHVGGRQSAAEYQYTLSGDDPDAIYALIPKLIAELRKHPDKITDVNTDMQQNGLQTYVSYNRTLAMRYGFAPNQLDSVIYDAFGQRTVSTVYNPNNQYFVVMEVDPKYTENPNELSRIFASTAAGNSTGTSATQMPGGTVKGLTAFSSVTSSASGSSASALNANAQANALTNAISNSRGGTSTGSADSTSAETMVPLSAMATWTNGNTPIQVNHQSGLIAATISFNLPPGGSMSSAQETIHEAMNEIGAPASVIGGFQGSAQVFQQSLFAIPLLVLAALFAIYIVLGILYENTVHPLTILTTLPSAGVGAVLALMIFNVPFSMVALIGIFLLIGIVKKNAIMMIDVAIHGQKNEGTDAKHAIYNAAVIRLRPIMMTSAAAILGAVPLAIGIGQGASLRQPLGITVMGGLLISQIFTLYTTPVIYVYLDRVGKRVRRATARLGRRTPAAPTPMTSPDVSL